MNGYADVEVRTRRTVVDDLRARGDLWEPVRGSVGLKGTAMRLFQCARSAVRRVAATLAPEEWRVPDLMSLDTLERADYFASFPQWLTVASHLTGDADRLLTVAQQGSAAVPAARAPGCAALPPALCYHTYAHHAQSMVNEGVRMRAGGTCWRHEGAGLNPLARAWSFTMEEAVFLGTGADAKSFAQAGLDRTLALAAAWDLPVRVVPATDPFFAPTAAGKATLQKLQGLKREVVFEGPSEPPLALASANEHRGFFGEAFSIRLADGTPASSACVAWGIERWLLALLQVHGPRRALRLLAAHASTPAQEARLS